MAGTGFHPRCQLTRRPKHSQVRREAETAPIGRRGCFSSGARAAAPAVGGAALAAPGLRQVVTRAKNSGPGSMRKRTEPPSFARASHISRV
jgi:hypothetical protein